MSFLSEALTLFRFYMLRQNHLAEDVFVLKGDESLGKLHTYPNERSVRTALRYADEGYVTCEFRVYLEDQIKKQEGEQTLSYAFGSPIIDLDRILSKLTVVLPDGSEVKTNEEKARLLKSPNGIGADHNYTWKFLQIQNKCNQV